MVVPSVWGFLHFQNQQSHLHHLPQALVVFLYVPMIQVLHRTLRQSLSMSLCCHGMKGEVQTSVVHHHLHYLHPGRPISCVLKVLEWRGFRGETTTILQMVFLVQGQGRVRLAAILHVTVDPIPEGRLFLGLVHHFTQSGKILKHKGLVMAHCYTPRQRFLATSLWDVSQGSCRCLYSVDFNSSSIFIVFKYSSFNIYHYLQLYVGL